MKKFFILSALCLLAQFSWAAPAIPNAPESICADCDRPTAPTAANLTGSSADLSWVGVATAIEYYVEVANGKNNPNLFLATATVTGTNYTITGLTPGLNYKFKVRARCSNGSKSNWTIWKDFNSTGAGACTVPMGLAASNLTPSSATCNWGAVGAAISYTIQVENGSGNPNFFKVTQTVTTNSYNVTGLLAGMNYKFKVRTNCLGGVKSAWSPIFTFVTPASATNNGNSMLKSTFVADFTMQISPNPVRDVATLALSGLNGQVLSLQLMDVTGRTVMAQNLETNGNVFEQDIEIPAVPNGVYFLKAQCGNQVKTQKILVSNQ